MSCAANFYMIKVRQETHYSITGRVSASRGLAIVQFFGWRARLKNVQAHTLEQ